jgi:hypothetical protein
MLHILRAPDRANEFHPGRIPFFDRDHAPTDEESIQIRPQAKSTMYNDQF